MSARPRSTGWCLLLCACQTRPAPAGAERAITWIVAPGLSAQALDSARVKPAAAVTRADRVPSGLRLELEPGAQIELSADGACPIALSARPGTSEYQLTPRLSLIGPASDVGYDSSFEVAVRLGCSSSAEGSVSWQSEGAPLYDLTTSEGGYRLRARTAPMPAKIAHARAGEIVAVSPAERAETRLTARWTGPDGSSAQRTLRVVAAPRSRGLPNAALGERVLLGGRGYRVLRRPPGAAADPMPWGVLTSLVPDAEGLWEVGTGSGPDVRLFVSRYDSVPLDCGRAGCHATEAHAANGTPMTNAFRRLLANPGSTRELECALGCHTTGEPGSADGGFSHAFHELGLSHSELSDWDSLPRALRRTGGVGCLACHGPGQIPQPAARWGILRVEVCAYCHDAPPRYGHVQALRTTSMVNSDSAAITRQSAACARCHTTWGFLDSVRPERQGARMPPADAPGLGIGCAACHAVHDDSAVLPGLLRRVPPAAIYADIPESAVERSGACLYCHSPNDGRGPSSAAIWAGRGALDPLTQEPITGPAPHAAVPGGCVGCHLDSPPPGERSDGSSHTFEANRKRCSTCHGERPNHSDLLTRAERLLSQSAAGPQSGLPSHARTPSSSGVRERAIDLIRFVLEDGGVTVHNPAYAETLLDRAESVLSSNTPPN